MNKEEIRKYYKNISINRNVVYNWNEGGEIILSFFSINGKEPHIEFNSNFFYPKIELGFKLKWIRIKNENEIVLNKYGIKEPQGGEILNEEKLNGNTIVLTPGLCFSEEGMRIGRGGGYYDRFFGKYPFVKKIGISFKEKIIPINMNIFNDYDIKMDRLIGL